MLAPSANIPSLSNPLNLKRLTIGVTGRDGKRAEIVLDKQADAPFAPLVPVLDALSALQADEPADTLDLPTEREINELYLLCSGWMRVEILRGIGDVWEDPIGGGAFAFADALRIQDRREESDSRESAYARAAARAATA